MKYTLTSITSPLFVEDLDMVTQNFKTKFSSVKLLRYYPYHPWQMSLVFQKCSVSVIITSNMAEKKPDGQKILWMTWIWWLVKILKFSTLLNC